MAVDPAEVEGFLEDVDEVSRLIDGLAAGRLPPEYVDGKIAARRAQQGSPAGRTHPATAGRPSPGKQAAAAAVAGSRTRTDAATCRDAGKEDGEVDEARRDALMRKVRGTCARWWHAARAAWIQDQEERACVSGWAAGCAAELLHAARAPRMRGAPPPCVPPRPLPARQVDELKANRVRKLRARAKYEEYVRQRASAAAAGGGGGGGGIVDYAKWDLWCPSDEEDALFDSLAPQDPGFRAMERDIDERHKRCAGQQEAGGRGAGSQAGGAAAGRPAGSRQTGLAAARPAAPAGSQCLASCPHAAWWSSGGSPSASASRATRPWRRASGPRRCAAMKRGWRRSATTWRYTPTLHWRR